ncbi:MAG TPA: adenine phosphoribosyltransferase [Candidatus Acidoferrales bacterium]|nr:adenine phosphoribosyltransferase [Candidatus Acidoferrales bacterium]
MTSTQSLRALIREVPDFPRPGVVFRDITPLLANAAGLRRSIRAMSAPWRDQGIEVVVSMEARGFIFGTAVAAALAAGFVPVRKAGKLPWNTVSTTYRLEYGEDALEIHRDALAPGSRVLLVDDVIATGGTAAAALKLIEQLGGLVVGAQFLIELVSLGGRARLGGRELKSVIAY